MKAKRVSIPPTYDHRETGDQFWVTSTVNGRPVVFRQPVPDPFVRHTVHVGWRDLVKSLVSRRSMTVEVTVGGEPGVIEDVLELNADYLGTNCTRRDAFNSEINDSLRELVAPKDERPLHAHEVTPEDAACIRMLAGAHFSEEATLTLPSGRTISGAEARRWVAARNAGEGR